LYQENQGATVTLKVIAADWEGPRVPVKVQRMEPDAPMAGVEMFTDVRFGGSCGTGALTKVVKAGVLSKITMLFSGSLLVFA
jgi:hypothetical protein